MALLVALLLVLGGELALYLSHEKLMGFEDCILRWKIDVLEDRERRADVLLLGASRVVHGVIPREMEEVWGGGVDCVNLAINGCPVETLYVILDRYLDGHPPPRAVLASVVPLFLGPHKDPAGGFEVRSLFRFSDVLELGGSAGLDPLLFWVEGWAPSRSRRGLLRRGFQEWDFQYSTELDYAGLIYRRPGPLWARLTAEDGYAPYVSGSLADGPKPLSAYFRTQFEVAPIHRAYLERLIGRCREAGIPLVLFATPTPLTLYNHDTARGYNSKVGRFWEDLLARHPEIRWAGPHLRAMDDRYFADWWCHPTPEGAAIFSRRLAEETRAFVGGA